MNGWRLSSGCVHVQSLGFFRHFQAWSYQQEQHVDPIERQSDVFGSIICQKNIWGLNNHTAPLLTLQDELWWTGVFPYSKKAADLIIFTSNSRSNSIVEKSLIRDLCDLKRQHFECACPTVLQLTYITISAICDCFLPEESTMQILIYLFYLLLGEAWIQQCCEKCL